ncbi:MAG: beta-propeller domain-containing protein [Deltaproteobacteria bacterium]|nr:beta-propeller domain-containing protein [Deltaproteobacteria bacterium]
MNLPLRFRLSSFAALASSLLVASVALTGCGADGVQETGRDDTSSQDPSGGNGDAARAISEADIIQSDGGRLYAMSKSGTVSIVDISVRGRLALLGQTRIAGEPFEMFRRGELLVAMTNRATSPTGTPYQAPGVLASSDTSASTTTRATIDEGAGAAVVVLDVSSPSSIRTVTSSRVPGEMADSRIVGNVLYTATYENGRCYGCVGGPRTVITSFDVSRPNELRRIDQASFSSDLGEGFSYAWGSAWKRSIFVTETRLYVGGHADIVPKTSTPEGEQEGIIDVLDISDPSGRLGKGARLTVAGPLLSRWQIDERRGVLRVVSQKGAGRTANGVGFPEVETFTIASTQSFLPLGRTPLRLPRQEGLRTVRFDDDRAYAITYNQTDPLFVIDLRDPAKPVTRGELHMPGFMFHLEPHGDRLLGLGIDRRDPKGSLNVSLFDVADMDQPTMIERVAFGATGFSEDYAILNLEVPEDQDRIQKAFRVLDGGLVVVPHSVPDGRRGTSCGVIGGGAVQLVQWSGDTLEALASLPTMGNARRAFLNQDELVAVSDSNVTSFDLTNRRQVVRSADVEIGECVARRIPGQPAGSAAGYDPDRSRSDRSGRGYMCAVDGGAGLGAGGAGGASGLAAALALSVMALRRRARALRRG